VALAAADATAFEAQALFGRDRFDRVFISYSLSMIPDWEAVVRQAAGCVAPRGGLHIVDFGDFAAYPALFRQLQLGWLRRFSVTPIEGFESRVAALAAALGFDVATDRLYGGYAVRACLTPRRQS
jgi:S-adenosylmethionine-diacylgycerolhomoserine-N-methlytransferase